VTTCLGLRVFPVKPGTKRPLIRGYARQATRDPETIQAWGYAFGDCNLGLMIDPGFFVLDVDPRNGGDQSLRALCSARLPFNTAEALTGSGGRHFVFRVDERSRIRSKTNWRPGLDILAEGKFIVVEPSTHPETGREYVWLRLPRQGIRAAPRWLVDLLPKRRRAKWEGDRPRRCRRRAAGDFERMLWTLVERFPVLGHGERHDRMRDAVCWLVCEGYDDDLVVPVMMAWWEHFHALGRVRTGRSGMRKELMACLGCTRSNPDLVAIEGAGWHRNRCRAIRLSRRQRRLLGSPIQVDSQGNKSLSLARQARPFEAPDCESLKRIERRLCKSEDEAAFVEALVVHFTHRRLDLGEWEVRMTDDFLRQIAAERRPEGWRPWSDKQMDRLKAKYLWRPGLKGRPERPATRFELARVIETGCNALRHRAAKPSVYRVTGIACLLADEARIPEAVLPSPPASNAPSLRPPRSEAHDIPEQDQPVVLPLMTPRPTAA
jgi:putative DNA primase/helicase